MRAVDKTTRPASHAAHSQAASGCGLSPMEVTAGISTEANAVHPLNASVPDAKITGE